MVGNDAILYPKGEIMQRRDLRNSDIGPCLFTYTGRILDPFTVKAKDIHIMDIAHSLARQCRYNGHVSFFYSVAQHCVLMAESKLPGTPQWKLMHDAAEAYLPDVVSGFKRWLPKLVEAEDHIMLEVAKRFELPSLEGKLLAEVKQGDVEIRYWEGRMLMPEVEGAEWSNDVEEPKVKIKIEPWPPHIAEERFIKCFRKFFDFTLKETLCVVEK